MVKIIRKEFGELLRKLRTERGTTLRQFAKLVGKSAAYISVVELGGEVPPSEKTIRIIAKELNYNEDLLLGIGGKVSNDIIDIIIENPIEAARLLRATQGLGKEEWKKLISRAEVLNS